MKIRGTLLGTIEEQRLGGDPNPVDPARITFDEASYRVSIMFDATRSVGQTTRMWREDGRILFEADINDEAFKRHSSELAKKAAIGFIATSAELAYDLEMKDALGYTVKGGRLFEVGLTDENENRNQPPFEVIDDATV